MATNIASDTSFFEQDVVGSMTLPSEINFGITYYSGRKYAIGINYSKVFWSNYKNDANPENLSSSQKISIGGYYRPDFQSFTSIFKRSSYRFGLYYQQDPRTIQEDRLSNYGLTFGIGMPLVLKRNFAHLNLTMDLGRRGSNQILREIMLI